MMPRRPFLIVAAVAWTACVLAPLRTFAQTGVYTLSGGTDSQNGQTYAATAADQSSVLVSGGGNLTLTNGTLTKSGNASSSANNYQASSQYGINAGMLVGSYNGTVGTAGTVTMSGTNVSTGAAGANGVFAIYTGSTVNITGGTISTTGTFSHGVDVTYGGSITLNGTTIVTSGNSGSAALSTDFGGGTISATNVNVTTAGSGSPAIYSTGTISVTGSTLKANGGYGGIIDGGNAINLTSSSLTAATSGVRVFRSAPGSTVANVTVNGGSITANNGAVFFVDGSSAQAAIGSFTLKGGTAVSSSTNTLMLATVGAATTHTTNAATFIADGETVSGNIVTDAYSTVSTTLQNGTTLSGFINNAAVGTNNLTIDLSSAWSVSAASNLNILTSAGNISGAGAVTPSATTLQSGNISVALAGTGSVTKTTSGTATLSNASNSYSGATTVKAGTLIVTGSMSGSAVTVGDSTSLSTSAKLFGTGTVGVLTLGAANGNTGATVDPGSDVAKTGILSTGNLAATSGAHLAIQLGGTTAGLGSNADGTNGYDRLNVAGTVSLGNVDLQLSLINGFGATLQVGNKFFIVLNDGTDPVNGAFAQGASIATGGATFSINYADNGDGGTVANDVSLTVQTVPEPSASWLMLGSSILYLGFTRRSRFLPTSQPQSQS